MTVLYASVVCLAVLVASLIVVIYILYKKQNRPTAARQPPPSIESLNVSPTRPLVSNEATTDGYTRLLRTSPPGTYLQVIPDTTTAAQRQPPEIELPDVGGYQRPLPSIRDSIESGHYETPMEPVT